MALEDDLGRIATAAALHGSVIAVLAAEPASGLRRYLVALGDGESRRWLVLDDGGAVVTQRDEIRDTASIVAMCELAEDLAGGGDLENLRAELARVRIVEQPPGIEEAEAAADYPRGIRRISNAYTGTEIDRMLRKRTGKSVIFVTQAVIYRKPTGWSPMIFRVCRASDFGKVGVRISERLRIKVGSTVRQSREIVKHIETGEAVQILHAQGDVINAGARLKNMFAVLQ